MQACFPVPQMRLGPFVRPGICVVTSWLFQSSGLRDKEAVTHCVQELGVEFSNDPKS